MSSLPVLRLPHLALIEVLKCWNPFQLFTFAQCSGKAARVVPLAGTSNFLLDFKCTGRIVINGKYAVDIRKIGEQVEFLYGPSIKYKCRNLDCKVVVETRSIWSQRFYKFKITSWWPDVWIGLKIFSFYLSDMFQCQITTYSHARDVTMLQFLQFGQEIVQKQKKIKNVSITFSDEISNDFPTFLDGLSTLNVAETLYLDTSDVDSGDYNLASVPKCFDLKFARWFQRKHLLSLENCTLIDLFQTGLVHNDINDFVNLWKSGEFSTLEYFEVGMSFEQNFERNSPIGGLMNLKDYSNRMRRIKKIYGHTVNVLEGVVIQREDGQKADVRLNFPESKFQMLVHSEKDTFEYVELIKLD